VYGNEVRSFQPSGSGAFSAIEVRGSHPAAAGSSRQDSQLGDGGASSGDAANAPGQAAPGQGSGTSASGTLMAPGSVGGATGSATPGGTNSATATAPANPSQPHGTANPTTPGQPSNPVAPSNSGNQPTAQPSAGTRPASYAGRLASGPSGLGLTERAAPQILSLPIYPQLAAEASGASTWCLRAEARIRSASAGRLALTHSKASWAVGTRPSRACSPMNT